MTEFTISGDIPNSNTEQIRSCISEGLKLNKIKPSQKEVYLENDTFSLYIYANDIIGSYDSNNYDFLISSSCQGSLQEVTSFITDIASALHKRNIEYNFEFYQDDCNNEDYTTYIIKHPNWKSAVAGVFIDISNRLQG
jgi:hypothetical protein